MSLGLGNITALDNDGVGKITLDDGRRAAVRSLFERSGVLDEGGLEVGREPFPRDLHRAGHTAFEPLDLRHCPKTFDLGGSYLSFTTGVTDVR